MGKGYNAEQHKTVTWEEVKKHSDKHSPWLVIDGEVYDATRWATKHPGGQKILQLHAGQDASVSWQFIPGTL